MKAEGKVVYLGLQKCGTTSFWRFFEAQGLRVIHNTVQACDEMAIPRSPGREVSIRDLIDPEALRRFAAAYDVLTDHPFAQLYDLLDETFPGSSFVLGTRPTDAWIASMQRHFGTRMPALGHAIYATDGNAVTDPGAFCKAYEAHNDAVRAYFGARPDFLEIQLGRESNDEITRKLQRFVGLPEPPKTGFALHRPA